MSFMVDDIADIRVNGEIKNIKFIFITSYESLERWIHILIKEDYVLNTVTKTHIVLEYKTDQTDICLLKTENERIDMRVWLENNGFSIPKVINFEYATL